MSCKVSRLIAVVLLAVLAVTAAAHSLHNVDIQVVINNLGHARVVEKRTYTITGSGSEVYIKQYNLGVMRVGELAVSDESGLQYDEVTPWKENIGREGKTGRCGIYKGESGPELCWGIGKQGLRTYVTRYTLTRLVRSFDDYDAFNFVFYEAASPYPDHVRVTISKQDGEFTPGDTRVWSFGHYGNINVTDGKIVAETTQPMERDGETITIMVRFNKGLFQPVTIFKGKFRDKMQKRAFEGSDYSLEKADEYDANQQASVGGNGVTPENKKSWFRSIYDDLIEPLATTAGFLLALLLPINLIVSWSSVRSRIRRDRDLKRLFGVKRVEAQEWRRDLPFNGDLNSTHGVLQALSERSSIYDLMGAYILRMAYMGRISVGRKVNQKGDFDRTVVVSNPGPPPLQPGRNNENETMYLLQRLMWNAAGGDHELEPKELMNYVKLYPVEHREFVKRLKGALETHPYWTLSSLKSEDAVSVMGLKKFLQEFTLSNERHFEEVALWREYMVHATLFGIAEQVRDDLKKVWPLSMNVSVDDFVLADTVTMSTVLSRSTRSAIGYVESYETPAEREARLEAEREAARSSGGGGSSSYGGGGGSSGGGGSGIR